jgi:hypothetical protein
MKTVRFVVPLLVTTFGFAAGASAQIYYPWCANYGSPGGSNCGFSTHEQCMATVSGMGGSCDQIHGIRPLREIQVQQRLLANLGSDTDIGHQK